VRAAEKGTDVANQGHNFRVQKNGSNSKKSRLNDNRGHNGAKVRSNSWQFYLRTSTPSSQRAFVSGDRVFPRAAREKHTSGHISWGATVVKLKFMSLSKMERGTRFSGKSALDLEKRKVPSLLSL